MLEVNWRGSWRGLEQQKEKRRLEGSRKETRGLEGLVLAGGKKGRTGGGWRG